MTTLYNHKFDMDVLTILPGEFYATSKNELIATILGSCISVVLIDQVNNVFGMNHFVLPVPSSEDCLIDSLKGRYGIFAMELLINKMIKLGSGKIFLRAMVFGGGSVLQTYHSYNTFVPVNNIRFAYKYLESANIPVIAYDIGGTHARKLHFLTGKRLAFVKKIGESNNEV